jgi:hypothetical protein
MVATHQYPKTTNSKTSMAAIEAHIWMHKFT